MAAGELLAWYGDSAYGTGDLRGVIADAGHATVIKPKPLQALVAGGLTVDDFTVNEQAGTVTCPAGEVPHRRSQPDSHRHLRRAVLGLPAAPAEHDLQDRPQAGPALHRCGREFVVQA